MSEDNRFSIDKDYDSDGNYEYCYVDNETGNIYNWADDYCETNFLKVVNKSINELKKQSNSKQDHINHLENKIHRMRKQIKKLEGLYHYRTADIHRQYSRKVDIYDEFIKQNGLSIDWSEICNYKCFFDEPKPCKHCYYFEE